MEPLVMQAAALYLSIKEGLADPRDMKIRPYKPEDLTAKEGQPDAADIIFNHPGYSDFSSHHIKLIAIALLSARESSFDHSDHIEQASLWGSCDAVSGCDQKSDRITYCAVDDSSVPLKWVAGRRLGPAEKQGSPAGLCAARFRLQLRQLTMMILT
ncbi:hypothetical protein FOCG_08805 [Fusarium oxysporum f. sp. radicis-lycopersici 26381]|nr:hypothetical protein FOCG_08805 [Fusarium oxysporum f. sp. radicis-lycopersici 26381]